MQIAKTERFDQIEQANERIKPFILKTPVIYALDLSNNGNEVYLKMESEQHTGSFKARGSMNKVLLSKPEALLVTASTGNHAQGMAKAIQLTGRRGIIFMPKHTTEAKKKAVEQYDIELRYFGADALETEQHAKAFAETHDGIYVSPYNDEDIIAGQGTIGIELLEDLPNLDYVFVTIGGGGLASGVATHLKKKKPDIKIIGCLPERSPDMYASIQAGKIIQIDHPLPTLSDGSAGGIEEDALTFEICQNLIDDYRLISEDEIEKSIIDMVKNHRKIIEGAAGVAIAGYRQMAEQIKNKTVAIIVCGGNISYDKLLEILCKR